MKDSEHPFFRPLWRRVAVVAVCLPGRHSSSATGTPFWGVIALGFAGYGVWQFFCLYSLRRAAAPTDRARTEKE